VRLHDLAQDDWVVLGRAVGGSFTDEAVALCRSAGFTPRIAQETNDIRVLFGFVAAGLGVTIGTTAGRDLGVRGIHFAPTSPELTMRFGLVARRDANIPALAALIHEIQNAQRIP
jgi:DNA-binding transcriptional LysR family regulator